MFNLRIITVVTYNDEAGTLDGDALRKAYLKIPTPTGSTPAALSKGFRVMYCTENLRLENHY